MKFLARRPRVKLGGIVYTAVPVSPGPPDDHLLGDWWHSDLIEHLNGPHGEPHTRACPLGIAHERHLVLSGFMEQPAGRRGPKEVGHDHQEWTDAPRSMYPGRRAP